MKFVPFTVIAFEVILAYQQNGEALSTESGGPLRLVLLRQSRTSGVLLGCPVSAKITKASMLAEFFFALAMLWWEGLRALKIDISS